LTVRTAEALPPALENLLVARIDRLPDEPRGLAQIAAAIGRRFPVRVLTEVAGKDGDEALSTLFRAEIVREVRRYPEFECAFTHGLLQEAALSTLTAARKRELYALIAAAFEAVYAESLDDHLERLAHYHAQSGTGRARSSTWSVRAEQHASARRLPGPLVV
jgi:predicted ATPase